MRAPTAADLLRAWEIGLGQHPVQRALTLLASASVDASEQELWALSIGQRDARLLELRRLLFGPSLAMLGSCPRCGERLESSVQIDAVRCVEPETAPGVHLLQAGDYRVRFRLPSCLDLAQVIGNAARDSARAELLERCVVEALDAQGRSLASSSLPEETHAAVTQRMAELDPQADVALDLCCPGCQHAWTAPFDIAGFLWREVHAWAERTLRDVHCLARAYGWSEAQTLSLSPARRGIYLELCSQ